MMRTESKSEEIAAYLNAADDSLARKSPKIRRSFLSTLKGKRKEDLGDEDETSATTLSLLSEGTNSVKEEEPKPKKEGKKKKSKRKNKKGRKLSTAKSNISFDTFDSIESEDIHSVENDSLVESERGAVSASSKNKKTYSKKRSSSKSKRGSSEKDGYASDGVLGAAQLKARTARAARAAEREKEQEALSRREERSPAVFSRFDPNNKPDKGYDSDGILGNAKLRARAARASIQEDRPEEKRKQSILDDLDAFDDRESVTVMYLKKHIDALKLQVKTLTSEEDNAQQQLVEEIQRNGELSEKMREQQLNLTTHEEGLQLDKVKALHKEEKLTWEKTLKEKDVCIDRLQHSINEILVNKDSSPLLEGDRVKLTQTHAKIAELEERIAIQKVQIDGLTLMLSEQSQSNAMETTITRQLKAELKQANADKCVLKSELEKAKKEYEISMKRKDETVAYFQKELTKLKQSPITGDADTSEPFLSPKRASQSPGSLVASFTSLVSPFGRRSSVSQNTASPKDSVTPEVAKTSILNIEAPL